MARVIRLFGKADNFDIEFSKISENWEVEIPPDLVDGVYAVQLTAVDELGEFSYWIGELYMCQGVCCMNVLKRLSNSFFKVNNFKSLFKISAHTQFEHSDYNVFLKKYTDIIFNVVEEKKYDIVFSTFNNIDISKDIEIGLTSKSLCFNNGKIKLFIQFNDCINIGKECSHDQ